MLKIFMLNESLQMALLMILQNIKHGKYKTERSDKHPRTRHSGLITPIGETGQHFPVNLTFRNHLLISHHPLMLPLAFVANFQPIRPRQPMLSSRLSGVFFRAGAATLTRKSHCPTGDSIGTPTWFYLMCKLAL